MRTTLTLDDDVAAHLHRLLRARNQGMKALVNEALREGLRALEQERTALEVTLPLFRCGPCLLGELVSVSEALAQAEGDWHR